jgi:hypothetical protein
MNYYHSSSLLAQSVCYWMQGTGHREALHRYCRQKPLVIETILVVAQKLDCEGWGKGREVSLISTVTISPLTISNPWRFAYSTLLGVLLSRNMRSSVVQSCVVTTADIQYESELHCSGMPAIFKLLYLMHSYIMQCYSKFSTRRQTKIYLNMTRHTTSHSTAKSVCVRAYVCV